MKLSDFVYDLPIERIAQAPLSVRDKSKLLYMNEHGKITDSNFANIGDFLHAGDLLILNNSRVIKSRLLLSQDKNIELYLNKPSENGWYGFVKPAKKVQVGQEFVFGRNIVRIANKFEMGQVEVLFELEEENLYSFLERYGHVPLPLYIKRNEDSVKIQREDELRYQTVYSSPKGSVAAPTAGLHFTEQLLSSLKSKGVEIQYVTLHVGAGTFLPVKTEDLTDHKMHSEHCSISEETANAINKALAEKRRIIAVGTTSLRVVESAASNGLPITESSFETDLFVTPGYDFKLIDGLITNFHLPKSTPLILTCSFAGYHNIMAAYSHALASDYRFCSYGDSCFFLKGNKNEI